MSDSLFQNLGKLSFPVAAGPLQETLDPARHVLLELFKSAILSEFGDVWATAVTGTPLAGKLPVQDAIELEPNAQTVTQRKNGFPLLCVHRTGTGTFEQHTLFEDRLTQQWAVDYILGPLDIAAFRQLGDVCLAVAKLIRLVVRQRGHRAYQSGALQFFSDTAGLASVEVKSVEGPGQAQFVGDDKGPLYYAVTIILETTEITGDNIDAYPSGDVTDITVGVGNADEIVPALIYAQTDV